MPVGHVVVIGVGAAVSLSAGAGVDAEEFIGASAVPCAVPSGGPGLSAAARARLAWCAVVCSLVLRWVWLGKVLEVDLIGLPWYSLHGTSRKT